MELCRHDLHLVLKLMNKFVLSPTSILQSHYHLTLGSGRDTHELEVVPQAGGVGAGRLCEVGGQHREGVVQLGGRRAGGRGVATGWLDTWQSGCTSPLLQEFQLQFQGLTVLQ